MISTGSIYVYIYMLGSSPIYGYPPAENWREQIVRATWPDNSRRRHAFDGDAQGEGRKALAKNLVKQPCYRILAGPAKGIVTFLLCFSYIKIIKLHYKKEGRACCVPARLAQAVPWPPCVMCDRGHSEPEQAACWVHSSAAR